MLPPAMLFTFNCKDAMNTCLRVFVKRSAAVNDKPSIQRAIMVLANSLITPERWNKINGMNSSSGKLFQNVWVSRQNFVPIITSINCWQQ